ncbi:hypothetical protein [Paenibacillus alkalitolerans]|uniref:hypothetical protein n=1 Tax=Paenibacillus alkalitolerans TaxID=2799335 RepID=UPI0018F52ABC|nr:hypothetical protein [Paenibacillus alkalitolerans]
MTKHEIHENTANQDRDAADKVRTVYISRKEARKKPWYGRAWPILSVVIAVSAVFIFWGLSGISQELSQVNGSIQEQTDVLREQNTALSGISREFAALTDAVRTGFDRLVEEIREAADDMTG